MMIVKSGPLDPDLPFQYGCVCGAVWNSSVPINGSNSGALCGPSCEPTLTPLSKAAREAAS